MGFILVAVVLAAVAVLLLLREPIGDWRARRRTREQERKRQWRRERDEAKAQRAAERAMNPVKAATRKGEPKWQQVAERQGGKCWLCGKRTYADDRRRVASGEERYGATYPTVDYVVPVEQGGTFEPANTRIAHQHCRNLRRSNPARRDYGAPRRTYAPAS